MIIRVIVGILFLFVSLQCKSPASKPLADSQVAAEFKPLFHFFKHFGGSVAYAIPGGRITSDSGAIDPITATAQKSVKAMCDVVTSDRVEEFASRMVAALSACTATVSVVPVSFTASGPNYSLSKAVVCCSVPLR